MLKIQSSALASAIKLARPFVPPRAHKPVLGFVRLTAKGTSAAIVATDLDFTFAKAFKLEGEAEFDGLIQPDLFIDMAKVCPGSITLRTDEGKVVVEHESPAGGTASVPAHTMTTTYRLESMPVDQFPAAPVLPESARIATIDTQVLVGILRRAVKTIDAPYGLGVKPNGQRLLIAGTDGLSMAYQAVDAKVEPKCKEFSLGAKAAKRLATILRDFDGQIELRQEGERLCLIGQGWYLGMQVNDASFPVQAWDLLQREESVYCRIDAKEFTKAFRQAATADAPAIRIDIAEREAILTAGMFSKKLKAIAKGKTTIMVPEKCLSPWLKALPSHDWVGICATDRYSPAMFIAGSQPLGAWYVGGEKRPQIRKPKPEQPAAVAA